MGVGACRAGPPGAPPDSLARPPGHEARGYKTSTISPIFTQYTGENNRSKAMFTQGKILEKVWSTNILNILQSSHCKEISLGNTFFRKANICPYQCDNLG